MVTGIYLPVGFLQRNKGVITIMQVTVKGKQVDVGNALTTHVTKSLQEHVKKFFDNPIEATVVFSKEAHLIKSDIKVHVGKGILMQSYATSVEPYPAFDLALEKMSERLRRHKKRLREHHKQDIEQMAASYYIVRPEIEEAGAEEVKVAVKDKNVKTAEAKPLENAAYPTIVAEVGTHVSTLTVAEAVMRMDLANLPALLFKNKTNGRINMVYRRDDGNIGWVDPTLSS